MNTPNAKYWVASNGDTPVQVFFDQAAALASENHYLDAFDKDGLSLEGEGLKFVDGAYTNDF